jgi:hypothetical protein
LDMAYQWITSGDEIEYDATIEQETRSNRGQGKLIEEVKKGEKYPYKCRCSVYIWWKWNYPIVTSLSLKCNKKKHDNSNIGTNQVGAFEEPTKGFHRPKVGIGGKRNGDSNEEVYLWNYATTSRTSYTCRKNMY